MNYQKFEDLLQAKGLKIKRREMYKEKEIYACEGYSKGDRDDFSPHYKTMWAVGLDPYNLTLGEFFTTPIVFPIRPECSRLSETIRRAKEHIDNVEAARGGSKTVQ
jgi:hypothetical protein